MTASVTRKEKKNEVLKVGKQDRLKYNFSYSKTKKMSVQIRRN